MKRITLCIIIMTLLLITALVYGFIYNNHSFNETYDKNKLRIEKLITMLFIFTICSYFGIFLFLHYKTDLWEKIKISPGEYTNSLIQSEVYLSSEEIAKIKEAEKELDEWLGITREQYVLHETTRRLRD